MSLKAVVQYLDYRLKKDEEDSWYRVITAEHLATIAAGMKNKERVGFIDKRDKIWGMNKEKRDNRTAQEIINDTLKKRGIKLIRRKPNEPV